MDAKLSSACLVATADVSAPRTAFAPSTSCSLVDFADLKYYFAADPPVIPKLKKSTLAVGLAIGGAAAPLPLLEALLGKGKSVLYVFPKADSVPRVRTAPGADFFNLAISGGFRDKLYESAEGLHELSKWTRYCTAHVQAVAHVVCVTVSVQKSRNLVL